MTEDLSSYMHKTAEGDKESFRKIANCLGYKMHATAIKILGSSHYDDVDDVFLDILNWKKNLTIGTNSGYFSRWSHL